MVDRVKADPIAKFNLDKPIINFHPFQKQVDRNRANNAKSMSVRKQLEKRIAKQIPQELLTSQYHKNGRLVRFIPTETQKRMVWQMAAMGASSSIIALAVIDPDTGEPIDEGMLQNNFGVILQHAREQANFTVALKIYELAVGNDAIYDQEGRLVKPATPPNFQALSYWDKTRGEGKRLLELRKNTIEEGGTNVTLVIEAS